MDEHFITKSQINLLAAFTFSVVVERKAISFLGAWLSLAMLFRLNILLGESKARTKAD